MRIIIFWDSISEWFWDYENGGWVNRLKIDFWKRFWYEKIVFNYWISAYTSEHLVQFFDWFFNAVSKREIWKEKESVIILAIWINDSSEKIWTGEKWVSISKFKENIELLIQKCKSEKYIKDVFFLGNINVDEWVRNDISNPDIEKFFYNSEIQQYNAILKELAEEASYHYLELHWCMENDDLSDGLHPNSQWHEKIYKKIVNFLEDNSI